MEEGKKPMFDNIGYVEKCLVAARASLNASALGKEGNSVSLLNCGIDTLRISTLGEYLAEQKIKEKPDLNNDEVEGLLEDDKLARVFVVPVTLPNGQEIDVIVNKKGQDIACMYRDEEGNEKSFQLTPRMKKQIDEAIPEELEQMVGEKVISDVKRNYLPENVEELGENISKDELVPTKEKVLEKINNRNGVKNNESNIEENENEIPEAARDIIAKICSENDLDIRSLKQVMEVPPETISDNLENTGFRENDGKVMVQGDKVVDSRAYDDYMNDYMNEHKGQRRVETTEDEHDKLEYTDLHGNTTVCEITREPRDLNCSEKEELREKMAELHLQTLQINDSDMPIEMKAKAHSSINQERLDLFEEYGIEVPLVENEIEADMQITEEIQENAEASNEITTDDNGVQEDDEIEAFVVPGKRTKE